MPKLTHQESTRQFLEQAVAGTNLTPAMFEHMKYMRFEDMDLSVRANNVLKGGECRTMYDLCGFSNDFQETVATNKVSSLKMLKNFGKRTLEELKQLQDTDGLIFAEDFANPDLVLHRLKTSQKYAHFPEGYVPAPLPENAGVEGNTFVDKRLHQLIEGKEDLLLQPVKDIDGLQSLSAVGIDIVAEVAIDTTSQQLFKAGISDDDFVTVMNTLQNNGLSMGMRTQAEAEYAEYLRLQAEEAEQQRIAEKQERYISLLSPEGPK